tara:strand:- start:595 stop:807 length:213 start_codon:yes stop_codon:yes gene_type:complete
MSFPSPINPDGEMNVNELHSRQHKHEFNVQFSVISKDRNFLNALEDINSNELGDQIKALIKEENRQFTTE